MKKTVYLMESFITYVNKGSVELDLEYFPELQNLSNEEIAEKLRNGEYYVNCSGEIMPKELPDNISEEIKEEYINEDGEIEYDIKDMTELWEYHNESEVDFDKIKDERSYFLVN